MGSVRAMRIPDFKTKGKAAFERQFINKPLEPVSGKVYDYLEQVYKEQYGRFVLGPQFKELFANIYHFCCVLSFVVDVHDKDWMKKHYELKNEETLTRFKKGVDDALLREMATLSLTTDKIWFTSANRKDLDPILDRWNELLNSVPNLHNIDYDKDEVMSDQYIQDLQDTLIAICEGVHKLETQSREVYINGVIQIVKDSGLKPTNALYRDIYESLRIGELISKDQLHVHDNSTNRYVRENFIKAKYNRH